MEEELVKLEKEFADAIVKNSPEKDPTICHGGLDHHQC